MYNPYLDPSPPEDIPPQQEQIPEQEQAEKEHRGKLFTQLWNRLKLSSLDSGDLLLLLILLSLMLEDGEDDTELLLTLGLTLLQ